MLENKERDSFRQLILDYLDKNKKCKGENEETAKRMEEFFYREELSQDAYLSRRLNDVEKYLPIFEIDTDTVNAKKKTKSSFEESRIISAKVHSTKFEKFNLTYEEFANIANSLKFQFKEGDNILVLDGKANNFHLAQITSFSDECPYICTVKWTTGFTDKIYLHHDVVQALDGRRSKKM